MWLWLYFLSLPLGGLLVAALPLKRARGRALLGEKPRRYVLWVFMLAGWGLFLLILVLWKAPQDSEPGALWVLRCVPGAGLAFVRAALEAKYVRRVIETERTEFLR